jgi:hypothetical protein
MFGGILVWRVLDPADCKALTKSFPIIVKQIRVSGVFLLDREKRRNEVEGFCTNYQSAGYLRQEQ